MAISLGSIGPGNAGEAQRGVNPNAFGVGVGQAIGGLAESLTNYSNSTAVVDEAKQQLALSFQGRQDKVDRSIADIGLIQTQATLQRDLLKLQDTLPLGAPGYTEQAQKLTDAAFKGYLSGIPERIRTEYTPRAAAAGTDLVDNAFNFQLNAQDNAFKLNTADLAQAAIDSISSGEHDLTYWRPVIENAFLNSTLDAAESKQLKDTVLQGIQGAALKRTSLDFALNPAQAVGHTGGPEDGSDVVATGIPGEYRALLNVIAGVESSNSYTAMNSGGNFTSFADHPGSARGHEGQSSAAGRYQFIYSTWKRAQAALGLPDFSPESQDRAAVWLAEQDYTARTGRNLQADLQSGDHALVEQVRKSLAGQGMNNVTWQALQGVSPDKFFASVTGQEGTMSSLLTSPEYPNLTYAQRQATINDAQAFAAQLTAQKSAAANARIEATLTEIQNAAVRGDAGVGAFLESVGPNGSGLLPGDKFVQARDFVKQQEQSRSDANLFANTMSGAARYDGNNPKQKSSYEALYTKDFAGPLASGDQAYFNNRILPFVQKTNSIPAGMRAQLAQLSTSTNPKTADFALQAILALKDKAPAAFAQLDKGVQDGALFYSYNRGTMPQEELLGAIRNMNDPASATQRDLNRQAGDTYMKSSATISSFSAESIVDKIIGNENWAIDPRNLGASTASNTRQIAWALQNEFVTEFQYQVGLYSDPSKAYTATVEHMKLVWGKSSVGGADIMMRRPPEKLYPNMGPEQMNAQLQNDFPVGEGESLRLVSDNRTEQDLAQNRSASYSVVKIGADGSILPVMMDSGGAPRPAAARMYFDPNYRTEAEKLATEKAVELQAYYRDSANDVYQPDTTNYLTDPGMMPQEPPNPILKNEPPSNYPVTLPHEENYVRDPTVPSPSSPAPRASQFEPSSNVPLPPPSALPPEKNNYLFDPTVSHSTPTSHFSKKSEPTYSAAPPSSPQETEQKKLYANVTKTQGFLKDHPNDETAKNNASAAQKALNDYILKDSKQPASQYQIPSGVSLVKVRAFKRLENNLAFAQDLAKKYPNTKLSAELVQDAMKALSAFEWDK